MTVSNSMKKLGSGKPGLNIFFSPKDTKPVCNATCKGCYLFRNYDNGQEALPTQTVPEVVESMKKQGYELFYPITTELLLAPNWEEILRATGDKHINTNGKIIAKKGFEILDKIVAAGVTQIVITANISDSHDMIALTDRATVQSAFDAIKSFNEKNGNALTTVATVIVTSENFDKIEYLCWYVYEMYKCNAVKFIAYIPFSDELRYLSPTLEQLKISIEQIEAQRKNYPQEVLYIQRGGTLGSQGLSVEKVAKLCPAGEKIHGIKSLKTGAIVTPCIYFPDFEIGKVVDGKVVLTNGYTEFLKLKEKALQEGYCPAHAHANGLV